MTTPHVEPKKESESREQASAKALQLAGAFAEVFGQQRGRSAAQRLVLQHLEVCASDDQNSYRFNESRDGVAMIAAGIHRDGAKSLLRVIIRQLELAAKAKEPKKAKPQIIK